MSKRISLMLLPIVPALLVYQTNNSAATAFPKPVLEKITFDLARISTIGLVGSKNSLRSLSYEFCIPADRQHLAAVRTIDPTIQYSRSRGRIGCTPNQYLCIAHTHQSNWREILRQIASLSYVARIDEFFGE